MTAIEVDFNHVDGDGRLLLGDLVAHERTPFADIAASEDRLLFVDGDEYVEGRLVEDAEHVWVAIVDWDTQDAFRAYPSNRETLLRTAT